MKAADSPANSRKPFGDATNTQGNAAGRVIKKTTQPSTSASAALVSSKSIGIVHISTPRPVPVVLPAPTLSEESGEDYDEDDVIAGPSKSKF